MISNDLIIEALVALLEKQEKQLIEEQEKNSMNHYYLVASAYSGVRLCGSAKDYIDSLRDSYTKEYGDKAVECVIGYLNDTFD